MRCSTRACRAAAPNSRQVVRPAPGSAAVLARGMGRAARCFTPPAAHLPLELETELPRQRRRCSADQRPSCHRRRQRRGRGGGALSKRGSEKREHTHRSNTAAVSGQCRVPMMCADTTSPIAVAKALGQGSVVGCGRAAMQSSARYPPNCVRGAPKSEKQGVEHACTAARVPTQSCSAGLPVRARLAGVGAAAMRAREFGERLKEPSGGTPGHWSALCGGRHVAAAKIGQGYSAR
jgi:hypothetical protein